MNPSIRRQNAVLYFLASVLMIFPLVSHAIGQCPAIGYSWGCAALITINPDGSLGIETDPYVMPYDGDEDTLVGVINRSGATVYGIYLTGPGIFGFDGDGASGGSYAGPGTSLSLESGNAGTVNFTNGLPDGGFLWFSLEGPPSRIKLTSSVTIDPGHGYDCAKIHQNVGAVGDTDYPSSDPPAGRMHEDDLTVAIGTQLQSRLSSGGYKVTMTKSNSTVCPTLLERGMIANSAHSNMFVSIHINAPLPWYSLGQGMGTSVLYNSAKLSSATLADLMVSHVASSVGVNNRGTEIRNNLAVLKPTVSRMTAVLVEVARLSGNDETILHTAGTASAAANGIKGGLDAFLNQ